MDCGPLSRVLRAPRHTTATASPRDVGRGRRRLSILGGMAVLCRQEVAMGTPSCAAKKKKKTPKNLKLEMWRYEAITGVDEVLTSSRGALGRGQGRTFRSPSTCPQLHLATPFSVPSRLASAIPRQFPSRCPEHSPGAMRERCRAEGSQGHGKVTPGICA